MYTPPPLINQQFGYVRLAAPLLDLAGISTEFGAISYSVLFQLFARRRQCHAARATRWSLPRISS